MSPVQGWAWLQDRHGYRAGMGQVDPPHEVAQASRVLAAAGPQWGQSVSVTKWEPGSRRQRRRDRVTCSHPGTSHTHQQEVGWGLAESPGKAQGPPETRGGQPAAGDALLSAS